MCAVYEEVELTLGGGSGYRSWLSCLARGSPMRWRCGIGDGEVCYGYRDEPDVQFDGDRTAHIISTFGHNPVPFLNYARKKSIFDVFLYIRTIYNCVVSHSSSPGLQTRKQMRECTHSSPTPTSLFIAIAFLNRNSRMHSLGVSLYICLFFGDVVLLLEQVATDLGLFEKLEISVCNAN